ncbi:MAG: hypothetical protein ACKN81_10310, partial [Pirellulaceae bacterium]
MSSQLDDEPFSSSDAVDMSSSAISIRLREVSELHQLGLSLAKAKPLGDEKVSDEKVSGTFLHTEPTESE